MIILALTDADPFPGSTQQVVHGIGVGELGKIASAARDIVMEQQCAGGAAIHACHLNRGDIKMVGIASENLLKSQFDRSDQAGDGERFSGGGEAFRDQQQHALCSQCPTQGEGDGVFLGRVTVPAPRSVVAPGIGTSF